MFPVAEGGNGAKGTLTASLLLETNKNRQCVLTLGIPDILYGCGCCCVHHLN